MLPVVGIHAIGGKDDFPVSLIGVDRGHTNAGMGVDSGQDQRIAPFLPASLYSSEG
jgi:hypothetical protein